MRHLIVVVLMLAAAACQRGPEAPAPKPAPPAAVAHPRTEAELTTITLTPEAVQRLGIQTSAAVTERVAATRTLAGEVVVPRAAASSSVPRWPARSPAPTPYGRVHEYVAASS